MKQEKFKSESLLTAGVVRTGDSPSSNQGNDMTQLSDRIAGLSPAKRALLELRLKTKQPSNATAATITRRENRESAPLSFSQQRLWFLHQFDPESPVYNILRAVRLHGSLNVAALQKTLDAIVARHEILRTRIMTVDGNPVQIVSENKTVNFPVMELSAEPEREVVLEAYLKDEVRRPFNLASDLMLRPTLLRLGKHEHVLVLTTHHIASDGWSSGILLKEFCALYGAFCGEHPNPLKDLPIQYADYAAWQRQWLQGENLEKHLSYWKRQLRDAPGLLELPSDRPRPAVQTFRGARRPVRISGTLMQALKQLSQKEGVTLFMTLLAAFKTLLFRYTRQDDILVGVTAANRSRPEMEGLIGFFINNLVLRTDLSGNPTFLDVLARVREVALGAYSHQDVPFEKLVEELQPKRSLSHTPLFQVMFGFQNMWHETFELPGLTMSPVEVDSGTSKFDLFFSLVEEVDSIRGSMEYNTDLFDGDTVARLLGHFQTVLEGVSANPERRLSELPVLTDIEKHRLLEWNETEREFPKDRCIHHLFESQVACAADNVAVVFEHEEFTYRKLNEQSNQLANYLRKSGVGPEVLVGICMERGWEMVLAVLAVLKAGGAYVPLDPVYPRERLAFMLEDAGVRVLLTQEKLLKVIPEHKAQVIRVDSQWKTIARESEASPDSGVRPEHLAYVIYTSGSTGQPKGVQISHRAVVNFLNAMRVRPGLKEQDVLLAVTTLSFDIAGLEIFLPLAIGARVVIVSSAVAADGSGLQKVLERSGATVMQATPATWRLLLEAGWQQPGGHLKILCGGEALTRDLADRLLDRASSVWNMYGPTETTIWSSTSLVEAGKGLISVGRPIDNTQIYILDSYLNPVPVGVPGELCIGGAGLARGYKNRPELVAEKFIPDPFSDDPGSRLYRTGDLARYLSDGNIEVLGRIDYQVKIRGFRIELGEIESVLSQHSAVNQVIVADREVAGERRLIGYIVPKGKRSPSTADLKDFLRTKLPEHMIPLGFVPLESLPLTPNGKVDRRSLPDPGGVKLASGDGFIEPRDAIELQLASVWERVLGVSPIGMRDNFFNLGGYSLLAVRLFAEIEKFLGKKLPLATLFQAPTIEQLANLLRRDEWSPSWSSLVAIQPNGSKPPFFCVHAHGGNVLNFNNLARRLGQDRPFYGLQAQGLDEKHPKHNSVEEMATHYIKEIRTVQSHGPYFLGGYCFGGKVAFEMAHQLQAQGEEVSLLALIDAFAPGYRTLLPWSLRRLAQIRHHWQNVRSRAGKEKWAYILEKGEIVRAIVEKLARTMAARVIVRFGLTLPQALEGTLQKSPPRTRAYNPKVYPGRITVFAPTDSHSRYHRFESHMGWKGLSSGGLDIREIPGRVTSIIVEPYVEELARQLELCIDQGSAVKSNAQNAA